MCLLKLSLISNLVKRFHLVGSWLYVLLYCFTIIQTIKVKHAILIHILLKTSLKLRAISLFIIKFDIVLLLSLIIKEIYELFIVLHSLPHCLNLAVSDH